MSYDPESHGIEIDEISGLRIADRGPCGFLDIRLGILAADVEYALHVDVYMKVNENEI